MRNKVLVLLLAGAAVLLTVTVIVLVSGDDLVEQLHSDKTEERLAAIDELAARGSESGMRAIAELTGDPETRVACRALLAVASSKLDDRRKYIERAAKDDRAEVRQAAMVGLGRLNDKKRDAETLAQVVRDTKEDPYVRAAAVQAIGRLRAWDQRHAAIDALEDPSPLVRGRAAAALKNMVGRDFLFRANDPPEERAKAVANIRAMLR